MKNSIRYKVQAPDGFEHSYSDQIPNALEFAKDCAEYERGKVLECEVDILGHEISQKEILDFSNK